MLKRLFFMLFISIFSISLIGCSVNNKPILSPQKNNENEFNMGIEYKIDNLYEQMYDIQVYAKEYNYGKLKATHDLVKTQIKSNDIDNALPISIYEKNENIDIVASNVSLNLPLDFFNNCMQNGMAFSALDYDKEIQLNKELPIAVFDIGKKGGTTQSVDLDGDFKLGHNERDLVVYLKINKIN